MRWVRLTILGLIVGLAAAAAATELWPGAVEHGVGEPLYFTMNIRRHGELVAHPQLLGESGRGLRLLLNEPTGAPRLALDLRPHQLYPYDGSRFAVDVQLDLPDEHGLHRSVNLRHGEEVEVPLGNDVELSLRARRVRSPEFETWVRDAPVRLETGVEPE